MYCYQIGGGNGSRPFDQNEADRTAMDNFTDNWDFFGGAGDNNDTRRNGTVATDNDTSYEAYTNYTNLTNGTNPTDAAFAT
jgi:hypothetical protein